MTPKRSWQGGRMRYLYLDNIRGFSNTLVSLLDVNFLVGENSSGKTSFMGVFRMLSGTRLLMSQDAHGDDFRLGSFADMVSVHSADQSYFRVGFIADAPYRDIEKTKSGKPSKKKTTRPFAVLLTYKNDRGMCQLARFTCTMLEKQITISLNEEIVGYQIDSAPKAATAEDMKSYFLKFVSQHNADDKRHFQKLKQPLVADHGQYPLMYLILTALREADQNTDIVWVPPMAPDAVWIAPIRSQPRRTYDEPQTTYSSEGAHIPYVIKRILSSEKEAKEFRKFMKDVGAASGLFERIDVRYLGKRGGEAGPFQIDAYLDKKALGLHLMGYGVSQSLPILVELLDKPKNSWFGIQQPEVHLHPRAQAALGDVFFEMAAMDSKSFLIETHSDFTIDRFRLNYRKRKTNKNRETPESQILFFERKDKQNTVTPLRISKRGELPSDQPESYRQFFIREQLRLLGRV